LLNIEKTIDDKFPDFKTKPGAKLIFKMLKKLMHEEEINDFISKHQHLRGFTFLDKILDYFDFSYQYNARQLAYIPSEGRVLIVANHPIGSLDGLSLLKLVHSVRPDVKIVANELLSKIKPLDSLFLSVDNLSGKANHKAHLRAILKSLENEEAVIIFPSGEVSRIKPNGVKDGKWKPGFLKLAEKTNSPVLPIYVDAKNSPLFYSLSALYKPLGTLMLIQEMFNKDSQVINFHIGKPIPWKAIKALEIPAKKIANQFRKFLYQLDRPKKFKKNFLFDLFEETVVHPVNRKALKKNLKTAQLLGETSDGKKIYIYDYQHDSPVMNEIGRLRELTFRTVEEGTGKSLDLDRYDTYYRHLILWDEEDLEIVGAYRIGEAGNIVKNKGIDGLYTSTLFNFNETFQNYLPNALELGRSFVQPRYWGKRSLDYLWFGIGAYINANPHIKYLFGPVSLSNAYPSNSKELIVAFYQTQFGSLQHLAQGKRPYQPSEDVTAISEAEFSGDYKQSYKKLNMLLDLEGVKVPTLFKQYAEVCDDKGCHFIDFSIDPDFNNCIDSLILVEMEKLKPKKRKRYLTSNN
jgi:putative hemolysin